MSIRSLQLQASSFKQTGEAGGARQKAGAAGEAKKRDRRGKWESRGTGDASVEGTG